MDPYEKSKMFTKRYKKIKKLLKKVYGYESFRSKQYEIINRIIKKEDVCAIMSTGMGKSLCFQLPALYLDLPAIVISPLISLMDDQRLILDKLGISSCCYNSTTENRSKMRKEILQGEYQFIYITPESIVNMKDFLTKLEDIQGISLIAIDEAHCISSYGFDFRKAYREVSFIKELLPDVPILAVTATATEQVGKDICKVLGFSHTKPIKTSFDRPNLFLQVNMKNELVKDEKTGKVRRKTIDEDIVPIIEKHLNESIIIYCLTRKETEKIAGILKLHKIKCGMYHAGMATEKKELAHKNFINGKVKVIAATIAFGMGINKSDVRVVIHYGSPKNIEGYYQEIGRAGRDGKKSYCYAFYNYRDFKMQENFINMVNDEAHKENLFFLLNRMKNFMITKKCRRQILLEYFDEDYIGKCDFCDNCCGVHIQESKKLTTTQDIQKEAKMLIDLIESMPQRNFGLTMYINILRGSNSKSITAIMKKNKMYAQGKHRSVEWWKEMTEHLIKQNFLQSVPIKGKFMMQVIKPTKEGIMWANMAELGDFLGEMGVQQIKPVKMQTTI